MNKAIAPSPTLRNAVPLIFRALSAFALIFSTATIAKSSDLSGSVVQIQNQAEPGTGFFLQVGDKVVFITAKHVIGSSGEEVVLLLPGKTKLTIPLKDQVPINDIDSAVLIVRSLIPEIKPLDPSQDNPGKDQQLTVWGYPVNDKTTITQLTQRQGSYVGEPVSIKDGYSLLYKAQTQIGFSGGPILDNSGKVVGMHGRSESTLSPAGLSIRTGNALGIPISSILKSVSVPNQSGQLIDEKALAAQAGRASMKNVYQIISNSSMSDQILAELERAASGSIPKYCIEISKAYYYTFFSSLPDLSRASSSLTITKKTDGVDPAYYALGSLIGRKSADFNKSLTYDRILEQTGNGPYSQFSERRLIDEVKTVVNKCSSL